MGDIEFQNFNAVDFKTALKRRDGEGMRIIAEVKKASPSKGLPYFSFHLYSAIISSSPASLAQLEDVVTWIGYFCFTSNPIFYGCLNRQIREELARNMAWVFKWGQIGRAHV